MRKHWKKLTVIVVSAVLLLVVLRVVFGRFVFLDGVHFWWDYCSVDRIAICYWYDDEAGEFTGQTSEIMLRVAGFEAGDGSFEENDLTGEVSVSGFEMEEGHGRFIFYDADFLGEFRRIYCREQYIEMINGMSSPAIGYGYSVVFFKEHPEYIRVLVEDSDGEIICMGYMADSPEEAEEAKDFYESKNWWTENGV